MTAHFTSRRCCCSGKPIPEAIELEKRRALRFTSFMLAHQRREELLILAKTYPHPSTKYRETTCVAALTRQGEMRRLFPVPFRFLIGETRFQKWEWISAVVSKARNDHRPESHKIDVDSIQKMGEVVPTRNEWQERLDWARPHLLGSFGELEERRQSTEQTLGFVRPTRLLGLDITPEKRPDWTEAERRNLSREVLFDPEAAGRRLPLQKLPFAFHFRYECQSAQGPREYRHLLTDWEVGALY